MSDNARELCLSVEENFPKTDGLVVHDLHADVPIVTVGVEVCAIPAVVNVAVDVDIPLAEPVHIRVVREEDSLTVELLNELRHDRQAHLCPNLVFELVVIPLDEIDLAGEGRYDMASRCNLKVIVPHLNVAKMENRVERLDDFKPILLHQLVVSHRPSAILDDVLMAEVSVAHEPSV